jgi:tetratricopeptide (TPR) repeat protein
MQNRLQQLQQMLAQEPNDVFLKYAISVEYFSAKEFENALTILQAILKNNADYLPAYYQTGKCYEELRQIENAKEIYHKGIEIAIKQGKTKVANELKEALFFLED